MIASRDPVPPTASPHVVGEALESTSLGCIFNDDPFLDRSSRRASTALLAVDPSHWDMRLMQARDILQSYLDDMRDIVMREQFEAYAARIQLPLNLLTSSANITVRTLADLQDGFDDFTEMMQSLGVTDMNRTVKLARFIGNDHVVGIYETRLMKGASLALPPFHSKMWVGSYDGVWKAVKIHNTTKEPRWPMLYTRLGFEHWPLEET
jgi:hypothetical protein